MSDTSRLSTPAMVAAVAAAVLVAAAAGGPRHSAVAPTTLDAAHAVALQADGKIVAAGSGGYDFALARYRPSGALDHAFGSRGRVVTTAGFADYRGITSAVTRPNGKIVVAGWKFYPSSADDFVIAR